MGTPEPGEKDSQLAIDGFLNTPAPAHLYELCDALLAVDLLSTGFSTPLAISYLASKGISEPGERKLPLSSKLTTAFTTNGRALPS